MERVILKIKEAKRGRYEGFQISIINNNQEKELIFISTDLSTANLQDKEYLDGLKGIILEALDIENDYRYYKLEHLFNDYFILYKDYKKLMQDRLNTLRYKVSDIIMDYDEGYYGNDAWQLVEDLNDEVLNKIEVFIKEVMNG